MNFIMENWWLMIVTAAIVIGLFYAIKVFLKMPSDAQLASVQEWLLYAVAKAEKELGSGTGQLKLRYVYDMFILRFPAIANLVSFAAFSMLVDEALEVFREMLDNNESVNKYIGYGTEEEESEEEGVKING